MPKKKGKKQGINPDFTINDCANAPKPVGRAKKSGPKEALPENSWEDLHDEDLDSDENEENPEESKVFVYKKKRNHSKCDIGLNNNLGIVYPEIVWYLISPFIKPEEVGNFAGINRATYSITKRESFWRALYKRYCQNKSRLPEKFRIDNDYRMYGLRQKVIRALYHTYDVFIVKVLRETAHMMSGRYTRPYQLVGRRCVNVWYNKEPNQFSVYFKLKKLNHQHVERRDLIEELGRIDANPEEDTQILKVTCMNHFDVPSPALLGMTLSSMRLTMSCRYRRLHLGFSRSHTSIYLKKDPECSICIGAVYDVLVYDWWDPKYPHFEMKLPYYLLEEEALPMLKKDFFSS